MTAARAAPERVAVEPLIKARAFGLGFDLVGITDLGVAASSTAFDDWLASGYAGEMAYLARSAEKRRDSRLPVPAARSAIVVGMSYGGRQPSGPIARYARGDDYHDVLLERLDALHRAIEDLLGRPIAGKAYVDTGPILERDIAQRAGLGWVGKNTSLINPRAGSFFFLGTLLVAEELKADAPFEADRCGSCTRCLDACPTDAFVSARVLDATRCISYLTIELRGPIPLDLRAGVGELIYGCDICQEVCPWNVRFAQNVREPRLQARPENVEPDLHELIALTEQEFRDRYRTSPMKRAKRRGLARNVAVALGNRARPEDVAALTRALDDPEPIVREHAAWGLARAGAESSRRASPRDTQTTRARSTPL